MIEHIAPTLEGYLITYAFKEMQIESDLAFIKTLHHQYLLDYYGRKKATQQFLNRQKNIPVYIHESLTFIVFPHVKNSERIWINMAAISSIFYKESNVHIIFKSGHSWSHKDPKQRLFKRLQESLCMFEKLKDYITGL